MNSRGRTHIISTSFKTIRGLDNLLKKLANKIVVMRFPSDFI